MSPAEREATTSGLLAQISAGERAEDYPPSDKVTFDEILDRFGRRAFGVLVLVATLPAFLPLPAGAGAISGPLIAVFGAQMMFGKRYPWLPARLRQRGVARRRFQRFSERIGPWLQRIEKLVKPRLAGFTQHIVCHVISGLLLLALGILLSLPIPLTNYPLALLVITYAVALIERDGVLMIIAWVLGTGVSALFIILGEGALDWLRGLF
ncbi:exopolysaccharide biosynthesis protein [Pseudomarimonas salicorniae]|uniref:Exopolysaccharide biosynthesis protein n=1 Tax=Pseudomarimonas salicorniae TaxID=2933270 RepID=A0ABT0GIG6_9GAMM|nr:exopolysaccharide biosynthesis protein [Lysobacter sp. CAU 1642]MCK7594339.1 exopolysaccharide biosynthesis protein [Lysobacter sp. CAU 1642]